MNEKELIKIINPSGVEEEVELVTYLFNDDKSKQYLVYTKGEVKSEDNSQIIYISSINIAEDKLQLTEIADDNEWAEVQKLLKKIANAN